MFSIHALSILMELAIAVIALMLFFVKKKLYGLAIALTYGIYVFYDISKFISLDISGNLLYAIFFIATLAMLWAVVKIYKANRT
ncbi:MAG: hypothetical protein PHQ54_04975 [Candidatus Omnitrophica bacterium]|nr:hypothetical protein [Candidatus Omnitrophota bacterium]